MLQANACGEIELQVQIGVDCKKTQHRAHPTRATHAYFLVCTWLMMCELYCVLSFLQSHSIPSHVSTRHARRTVVFTFSDINTQSDDQSFAALSFGECNLAPPQEGFLSGPMAEESPLTLSLKSAASTFRSIYLRESSLDSVLNDLATTVDESDIIITTNVGQLTSPPFSQEREAGVIQFSVSGSQAHSSVGRQICSEPHEICARHGFVFKHWETSPRC